MESYFKLHIVVSPVLQRNRIIVILYETTINVYVNELIIKYNIF